MAENAKFCPRCQQIKPVAEWLRNAARYDGLSGYCAQCHRQVSTESSHRKRAELLATLGGKCVRCGFSDARALQIDHVNGGGRRTDPYRATAAFYKKVVDHPDEYQLLCANCNWIKKHEDAEHVGNRDYGRVLPTERKQGVGRHNPEANARRAAGLQRWREANPNGDSERAIRSNADPAGRARRSATMKARIAAMTPERRAEWLATIAATKRRKAEERMAAQDGGP